MGIQNFIGDITSNVGQSIQGFLDSAWSAVSGIGERVGTFVANIWDGGFYRVRKILFSVGKGCRGYY